MKFKVGDRVRIVYRGKLYGREGTVWQITNWKETDPPSVSGSVKVGDICYRVDVDGYGRLTADNNYLGYQANDLEPLIPPDELAWQQFKTYLQPNPAILPPIVTTSDEEAARIAETTPGSVINVVQRGVVVSTYWGKPW